MRQPARKSIGQALAALSEEFPDAGIKESKLRYLEAEGLIAPERTPAGYRKYSVADMERLRYIIRMQRDHYLPLKVIREHLDALDRGLHPPAIAGEPQVPSVGGVDLSGLLATPSHDVRVSRRELIKTAHITEEFLTSLEEFGLVRTRRGSRHYDTTALEIATVAGELARFGIEPRHLRPFRTAADRETSLIDQIVEPVRRSREPGAEGRAAQMADDIMGLTLRLHAMLIRAGLR